MRIKNKFGTFIQRVLCVCVTSFEWNFSDVQLRNGVVSFGEIKTQCCFVRVGDGSEPRARFGLLYQLPKRSERFTVPLFSYGFRRVDDEGRIIIEWRRTHSPWRNCFGIETEEVFRKFFGCFIFWRNFLKPYCRTERTDLIAFEMMCTVWLETKSFQNSLSCKWLPSRD